MVGFSKYELYNKLLGGMTLFRLTLGITWTQPIYIYIYIYGHKCLTLWERERERERIKLLAQYFHNKT